MSRRTRQKSCVACIKGKRRCDLQYPCCSRCRRIGANCTYQSAPQHQIPVTPVLEPEIDADSHDLATTLVFHWWVVPSADHRGHTEKTLDLQGSISEVQAWLRQWHLTGSTPFIHGRLYDEAVPRCISDAYTACATYYTSTDATKDFSLRIIEQRVRQVLSESEIDPPQKVSSVYGLRQHTARCQALLTYQIIRLFDGDIRQRTLAEEVETTLDRWCDDMLECASVSSRFVENSRGNRTLSPDETWEAWLLAESTRRTWLAWTIVSAIYKFFQGKDPKCRGALLCTARQGLWDARSSISWKTQLRNSDPLIYGTLAGDDLLSRARPGEVDEFALWVVKLIGEPAAVEEWMEQA